MQPSGGPLLTWRRVVAPIVADEEKSQELAAALGIKCKAFCTADGIILAWMKRDFAEATVEALLRACRKIGVFDDVQAAATRKRLTFPSLSTVYTLRQNSSGTHFLRFFRLLRKILSLLTSEDILQVQKARIRSLKSRHLGESSQTVKSHHIN